MIELEYFVVDVFTSTPLAGNPLAVVMDSVGLTAERMQAIAREFNLSETTFVERRPAAIEQAEGVRVRIFTTQEELNFAGHPTLGTASVLKLYAAEIVRDDTVTLKLNVGAVPVRFDRDSRGDSASETAPLFGEMTQRDPEFGAELDLEDVARLTGLAVDDFDPALMPQIVSTGTAFAIVVLRSSETLARLNVRQQEAAAWLGERGARWFYVLAPTHAQAGGSEPAYRARMQFNGGEDPATGSAAGCAIAYLVARGAVPPGERIHVRQGVEVSRPSDLYLSAGVQSESAQVKEGLAPIQSELAKAKSVRVRDVRVADSTVLGSKGRLFLP
jgi:trans-2,3-dihydro-3-hydroxyanthranilate isomerase